MPPNPHIERLVTSIKGETALEHLHRYAIARDLAENKKVLDLGSGEGYGSALLAQTALDVIGVDIDKRTINHASRKYSRDNLRFQVASATDLPLEPTSIDLVVCFELIEHLMEQDEVLSQIKRVLRPEGILIISTPEKEHYSGQGQPLNPYHVKELSGTEFRCLLTSYFDKIEVFGQRVTYASNILEAEPRRGIFHKSFKGDYHECISHQGVSKPRYLVALCSDAKLPSIPLGLFEDTTQSDVITKRAHDWIRGTTSARLQVFSAWQGSFREEYSNACDFVPGRWQHLKIELGWGVGDGIGKLRLDPTNGSGIIDIAGLVLRSRTTGEIFWRAKSRSEFDSLTVSGTAISLPHQRLLRLLSVGEDPQIHLPAMEGAQFALPLVLEVWIRFETSSQQVGVYLNEFAREHLRLIKSAEDLDETIADLQSKLHIQKAQLDESEASELTLRANLQRTEASELTLRANLQRTEASELTLRANLERVEREAWENKARRADLTARLKERDRLIQDVQGSAVWKAIKPLWKLQRHFSGRPNDATQEISNELVFALDAPSNWTTPHDVLLIRGWCLARSGPEIVGVRAKVGRKSYFARYGLERPDLARPVGSLSAAMQCGFAVEIPVPRGASPVRLEAIAHGEAWQCFSEHTLIGSAQQGENADAGNHADAGLVTPGESANDEADRESLPHYPNLRAHQVPCALHALIKEHASRLGNAPPYFSIITPTFNPQPRWIAEAAATLLNQTFANWEWCLVDDRSQEQKVQSMLEALAVAHPRFRVKFAKSAGISSATNAALDLAIGEFVCFMDHDDLLHPQALEAMAEKLREGFDVVYSDEDKLDDKTGALVEPFFKPDWSPEYLRGAMYVGHLLCVRRELASRVRFDREFDGVQDFEFMLRVSETGARIGHIPRILYHWRKAPGSIADKGDAKPQIGTLQQKAVNAQLERLNLAGRAEPATLPHRLKIVPVPRKTWPKVSVIIPTKDSPELIARCLKSLYGKTSYPDFEVILVDNDTTNHEALDLMRAYPIVRLPLPDPFNFSRANNLAARHATGDYLAFLNNDTEIVSATWLEHLLYYAEQPDVGAAGALLLFPNGTVQHGGVVLGMRGTADHAMRGFPVDADGYAGSLSCAREVSAVTAACMMIRKSEFEEVKGFNEHFFTIYQDIDLCLRLRERGHRIIWTPQALVFHHESVSRKSYYDMVDRMLLLDQWETLIGRGDPYYNPNLNLERGDYSVRR